MGALGEPDGGRFCRDQCSPKLMGHISGNELPMGTVISQPVHRDLAWAASACKTEEEFPTNGAQVWGLTKVGMIKKAPQAGVQVGKDKM